MSLKKGIVALQTKCLWENFTHILQEFYPVWLNSVRGSGNYPSEELYEHYFKLLHILGHLHQSFCNVFLYVVILLMKASRSTAIWWNKMLKASAVRKKSQKKLVWKCLKQFFVPKWKHWFRIRFHQITGFLMDYR